MTTKFNNFNEVKLHSGRSETDILFTCASFEPRSTTAVSHLPSDFNATVGIIYYNKELQNQASAKVTDTKEELNKCLGRRCQDLQIVEGSINDPIEQLNVIRRVLESLDERIDKVQSITIDTTTFTRETLLILLNILSSWYPQAEIDILYVSPKEYGKWLSRGHRDLRNVIGHPGIQTPEKSMSLVVLSGFESDRMFKIIKELEPAVIHFGIGREPTRAEFLDRNLNRQEELLTTRPETREFGFPADNIDGSRDSIDRRISDTVDSHDIVFAPMSTKLSTIGCWKVAQSYPNSQVVYALPDQYNVAGYSEGVGDIYCDSFIAGLDSS